jgi:hypothetical protein
VTKFIGRRFTTFYQTFMEVQINHVYRETNRGADMLANLGCEGTGETVTFDHLSTEVIQIIDDDCRGVFFLRLISL